MKKVHGFILASLLFIVFYAAHSADTAHVPPAPVTPDLSAVVAVPTSDINLNDVPALELFSSIPILILLSMVVTGWFTAHLRWRGAAKQIISWLVCIGIAFFGQWKGLGIFANTDTLTTLFTGIGVAIVSNGLFDAGTLDKILILLAAKRPKPL